MTNREKVIKEWESVLSRDPLDAPWDLIDETLALLKQQEAVEPIYIENPYTHLPVSYCPKCREPINQYITGNPYRKTEYCHYCGQVVKWDG